MLRQIHRSDLSRSNQSTPSGGTSWLLPISVAVFWISAGVILITARCFFSSSQCTCWGPETGGNFREGGLSSRVLALFLSGATLALALAVKDVIIARQQPRLLDMDSMRQKFKLSSAVSVAFGVKIVVGNLAIRHTSVPVYLLFDSLSTAFVFLAALILLDERPKMQTEILPMIGIMFGSALAVLGKYNIRAEDVGFHDIGLLSVTLNLCNLVLGGVVVALLRSTTLHLEEAEMSITELTFLKLIIGSLVVFPFALTSEGMAMFSLPGMQRTRLWISSAAIIVFEVNLSLICSLAPALLVGVVQGIKPVSLYIASWFAGDEGLHEYASTLFWIGTSIILASAIIFKLLRASSRPSEDRTIRRFGDRLNERTPLNERIGYDSDSDSSTFAI